MELYDENNLVDYLAIRFHLKRGYSVGLLPFLFEKESKGEIRIKRVKRLYFGNDRMEGYTYMVWETTWIWIYEEKELWLLEGRTALVLQQQ